MIVIVNRNRKFILKSYLVQCISMNQFKRNFWFYLTFFGLFFSSIFFFWEISNVPPICKCSCWLQHFWLYRLLPLKSLMQSKTSKAIRKMWNAVSSVWAMADMAVMVDTVAWDRMVAAITVPAWADTTAVLTDMQHQLPITHLCMSHHTHIHTALKPKSSHNHTLSSNTYHR